MWSCERQRACEQRRPTSLSIALWRPTSSRDARERAVGANSPAAWRPPVAVEEPLLLAQRLRQADDHVAPTTRPSATSAQRTSIASIDALPHTPQLDVA